MRRTVLAALPLLLLAPGAPAWAAEPFQPAPVPSAQAAPPAPPEPGSVRVRLNGRVRFYGGVMSATPTANQPAAQPAPGTAPAPQPR